jgi:hypothetical protein
MKFENFLKNAIRTIYLSLSYRLNSSQNLRIFIYTIYERLRLIQFKLKLFIYGISIFNSNLIYINPNKIIYEKDLTQNNWRLLFKFIIPLINFRKAEVIQIIDGNWDLKENLNLYKDHIKYVSYYQHFMENRDWKETPYYKREFRRYYKGLVRKDYKNIKELSSKFKFHDRLYEKIKKEGFKSQLEIIKTNGILINYGHGKIYRNPDDDITVAIGRDGDVIFFDGRHRLNVAKLLNLKKIPVRVLVIHEKFLSKLKKIKK